MGDLNDGPYNKSVKEVLNAKAQRDEVKKGGLFNPTHQLYKDGLGTIAYRDAWDVFDQIIISEPLLQKEYSSFRYWKAGIFNKPFLRSEEHTSELQSRPHLVCRLLLEKK